MDEFLIEIDPFLIEIDEFLIEIDEVFIENDEFLIEIDSIFMEIDALPIEFDPFASDHDSLSSFAIQAVDRPLLAGFPDEADPRPLTRAEIPLARMTSADPPQTGLSRTFRFLWTARPSSCKKLSPFNPVRP